jgi:hypothetical protein
LLRIDNKQKQRKPIDVAKNQTMKEILSGSNDDQLMPMAVVRC